MSNSEESDVPPLTSKYTVGYLAVTILGTHLVSEAIRVLHVPPKWAFIIGLPYTFALLMLLVWVKRWYAAEKEVRKYSVE